jgi:uncharacterized membrane protein YqgA involved in biofilm formation
MPGIGTVVNVAAVLAGTGVGVAFGRLIPERIRTTAMAAIGLSVVGLGLKMALDPRIDPARLRWAGPLPYQPNPLVIIGGLVLGGVAGELLRIEERLERLGERLKALVGRAPGAAPRPGAEGHDLVEGFVTASLLYCVGAMAVLGAIQDGAGQPQVLYVKSLLDGIASIVLATTLGAGVGLSVLPLAVYQGGITAAAGSVAPFLTLPVLATLTSSGGLLIAAIGLDLTGIKRLPIGNLLPGVFVAAALAHFFH